MKYRTLLAAFARDLFQSVPLVALIACAVSAGWTASASAETLLYRTDGSNGTDYLGQAIAASGFTVTTDAGSLSGFNLANYNVVVYANQEHSSSTESADYAALNAYIAGGGRVILDNWFEPGGLINGNAAYNGNVNLTTLTLGPQFSAGISSPLSVTNPLKPYAIFSTGLNVLSGGVSAGSFDSTDAAIVVGNDGRTIINGFLSDTVASEQLYINELDSLNTPLPAALPLFATGLGGLGLMGWRRKRKAQTVA